MADLSGAAFAACLVRDFLVANGMHDSLKAFEAERESRGLPGGEEDPTTTWYSLSRAVDFPAIKLFNASVAARDHGGNQEPQTALAEVVTYLCHTHPAAVQENVRKAAYAQRMQAKGSHKAASQVHRASTPGAGSKQAEGSGAQGVGGSLDEMSLVDQALALEHDTEKDLFSIACETPLHPSRFVHATAARRHNLPLPSYLYDDTTGQPIGGAGGGSKRGAGGREAGAANGVGRLSKGAFQGLQASASVPELTKRLCKSQTKQLSKNPMSPGKSRAAHISKSSTSTHLQHQHQHQRRRRRRRRRHRSGSGGPSSSEDEDEGEDEVTTRELKGIHMFGTLARFPKRPMEHPDTYNTTMRIMGRDIRVGVINADYQMRLERERERERRRLSPQEQVRLLERYCGKKGKQCGLCEREFSIVNLPLSISFKAIIDVRRSFGAYDRLNPNLARAPRCYDQVRVCLFCSQFFDSVESYRPDVPQKKNEDDLLLEFQKSIEHLEPGHESAFFRKP